MNNEFAFDAVFFMFFGIGVKEAKESKIEELILLCAKKAYRDLCRTIKYNGLEEIKREEIKNNILKIISEKTYCLMLGKTKNFDEWHKDLCNKIIDEANKYVTNLIHVGQTQKWINMTLKYLRMMGIRCVEKESEMHIPVDNYIIEAASKYENEPINNNPDVCGLGITFECSVPWSKCDDYDKYKKFQDDIKGKTKNKQLEWEEKAWMEMASLKAAE